MSEREQEKTEALTELTAVDDGAGVGDNPAAWMPGQQLGPFRLKRQLGRGGMGMVWLAEQFEPLQREVAIKVLLQRDRSRLAEAYFEVERQMLAQLSHRAIAQIHDAGHLPDGGLYFAMEYVPGVPLHDYLLEHPLSYRELARLFIEICSGLQHAHQRGLIHRDIKPHNILVRHVDGSAEPKIIDFGIAVSANDARGSIDSPLTRAGTRAWMAPEQFEPDVAGIDVRADLYALGKVLAQGLLILGTADSKAAAEPPTDELRQRLLTGIRVPAGEKNDVVSGSAELKSIPAELRAIAAKAMSPERERRYASAAAMADDLQRWLRHEPVAAIDGSRGYRLRCFLRRNALASAATVAISLSLIVGMVLAVHGMNQAREGRAEAEQSRLLAEQRRGDAENLIRFMLGDFAAGLRSIGRLELLDGVGSEALSYLSAQQAGSDPDSALNRARALRTLGEVQVQRQQFDQAREPLQQAAVLLAPWQDALEPELAEIHFESGQIAFWLGAISYHQQEWEGTEQHWQRYRRDAEMFRKVSDDPIRTRQEVAYAYNNLGTLAEARHRLSEALDHFTQARGYWRELNEQAPGFERNLANNLSWTGRVQNLLGLHADSWASAGEALELVQSQRRNEPDDARLLRAEINFRSNLGRTAIRLGLNDVGVEELREAVRLAEQDVANDPSNTGRQAELARFALALAVLPELSRDEALHVLASGRQALQIAGAGGLDPRQAGELPALYQRARLVLGADDERVLDDAQSALVNLLQSLQDSDSFGAGLLIQLLLAGDLGLRLQQAGVPINPEWIDMMSQQLELVPAESAGSLRVLLAQSQIMELAGDPNGELPALQRRIASLRAALIEQIQKEQENS